MGNTNNCNIKESQFTDYIISYPLLVKIFLFLPFLVSFLLSVVCMFTFSIKTIEGVLMYELSLVYLLVSGYTFLRVVFSKVIGHIGWVEYISPLGSKRHYSYSDLDYILSKSNGNIEVYAKGKKIFVIDPVYMMGFGNFLYWSEIEGVAIKQE